MEALMPTILVVDDDADTRQNMADLFCDRGYRVDAADCGNIALEQARLQSYDLGLLDLRMPGMDGLTLCSCLKNLRPSMVNVIVTGYPGDGLDKEARKAGACQVFPKPVDFARLLALVEQALTHTN
jgi:CheY-like chemotaxis protein